jgi:hypothetical protein
MAVLTAPSVNLGRVLLFSVLVPIFSFHAFATMLVVRWFGGSVVRWFGGSVVRWFGGP